MANKLLIIIFGLICGVFVGLLGTPGYALIVPGFLILSIIPNYTRAVGTYLLTVAVPLTIVGAYIYYTRNEVEIEIAIIMMITLFIGVIAGSYMTDYVPEEVRQRIAGTIESIIGPFYIWNSFFRKF